MTKLFGFATNPRGRLEGRITYHERIGIVSRLVRSEWTGKTFKTWKAAEEWAFQQNSTHAGR